MKINHQTLIKKTFDYRKVNRAKWKFQNPPGRLIDVKGKKRFQQTELLSFQH